MMDETTRNTMFSSKTEMWKTPQELFDKLDAEYHFDCDVCAIPENTKCKKYYTPEIDGLSQKWGGNCWCNPPYGKAIGKWIEKAYNESTKGTRVVMLIPARTDTKWFHEWVLPYADIYFIKGRLKFGNSKNSAPFPSMIVVFDADKEHKEIKEWS